MIKISIDEKLINGFLFTVKTVSDVLLKINPEGFILCAMDVSKYSLVNIKLDKDDFEVFECKEEELFQVNLEDFAKILPKIKKYEEIIMYLGGGIDFVCKNEGMKKPITVSLKKFDINIDEVSYDKVVELMNDLNSITVDTSLLKDFVDLASFYGDHFNIFLTEEELNLKTMSNMGEVEYPIEKEEWIESDIVDPFDKPSVFRTTHLKYISTFTDSIKIYLGSEVPLIFEWEYITFMTAPFIAEDDSIYD